MSRADEQDSRRRQDGQQSSTQLERGRYEGRRRLNEHPGLDRPLEEDYDGKGQERRISKPQEYHRRGDSDRHYDYGSSYPVPPRGGPEYVDYRNDSGRGSYTGAGSHADRDYRSSTSAHLYSSFSGSRSEIPTGPRQDRRHYDRDDRSGSPGPSSVGRRRSRSPSSGSSGRRPNPLLNDRVAGKQSTGSRTDSLEPGEETERPSVAPPKASSVTIRGMSSRVADQAGTSTSTDVAAERPLPTGPKKGYYERSTQPSSSRSVTIRQQHSTSPPPAAPRKPAIYTGRQQPSEPQPQTSPQPKASYERPSERKVIGPPAGPSVRDAKEVAREHAAQHQLAKAQRAQNQNQQAIHVVPSIDLRKKAPDASKEQAKSLDAAEPGKPVTTRDIERNDPPKYSDSKVEAKASVPESRAAEKVVDSSHRHTKDRTENRSASPRPAGSAIHRPAHKTAPPAGIDDWGDDPTAKVKAPTRDADHRQSDLVMQGPDVPMENDDWGNTAVTASASQNASVQMAKSTSQTGSDGWGSTFQKSSARYTSGPTGHHRNGPSATTSDHKNRQSPNSSPTVTSPYHSTNRAARSGDWPDTVMVETARSNVASPLSTYGSSPAVTSSVAHTGSAVKQDSKTDDVLQTSPAGPRASMYSKESAWETVTPKGPAAQRRPFAHHQSATRPSGPTLPIPANLAGRGRPGETSSRPLNPLLQPPSQPVVSESKQPLSLVLQGEKEVAEIRRNRLGPLDQAYIKVHLETRKALQTLAFLEDEAKIATLNRMHRTFHLNKYKDNYTM